MRTIDPYLRLAAVLGLLLTGGTARAASQASLDLGMQYHTWSSDLQAEGYETILPLAFQFHDGAGRLQVSASTGFVQGHYETKDIGFGGSTFDGNRLTDSKVGVGLSAPLGSFESAVAVQANLPTGDTRWENLENAAYIPNLFQTSYYQGRGFGLGGLFGLGKDLGGHWEAMVSGGYLYSSTADTGLDWGRIKPGSYVVLGASISRRTANGSFRLKAMQYLAQDTTAGDTAIYRAPSNTALGLHFEEGKGVRLILDAAVALYGKAKLLDVSGDLAEEAHASFGNRLSLHPVLEYPLGAKLILGTGGTFKSAAANGYSTNEALYNGGGTLLGVDQSVRWKMGEQVYTKYTVSYARITATDAAFDAAKRLTDVNYNDVTFGMGVGYQW